MLIQAGVGGLPRPQEGNTAIIRGLIFLMLFKSPGMALQPLNIPAPAFGAAILAMDLWRTEFSAFGGVSAAYILVHML